MGRVLRVAQRLALKPGLQIDGPADRLRLRFADRSRATISAGGWLSLLDGEAHQAQAQTFATAFARDIGWTVLADRAWPAVRSGGMAIAVAAPKVLTALRVKRLAAALILTLPGPDEPARIRTLLATLGVPEPLPEPQPLPLPNPEAEDSGQKTLLILHPGSIPSARASLRAVIEAVEALADRQPPVQVLVQARDPNDPGHQELLEVTIEELVASLEDRLARLTTDAEPAPRREDTGPGL